MRPNALFLILALLMTVGCQPSSRSVAVNRQEPELPPKEAAKVCLVTTRQLDRNGYDAEAIDEYEKARQLDPTLTAVARRLAVLYDRRGNDARALAEYQSALRETPNDADLLNDFGYFYVARNDGLAAEKWLRLALAADPQSQRVWVNLGSALAEQRRYGEAYYAFSRVLPIPQALSNVGVIQAQQGDYALAEQSLTQATQADPNLQQSKAALKWTRQKLAGRQ